MSSEPPAGRPARRGVLFVLSAPSGSGKSTLARRLVQEVEGLEFSVSTTTRPPRPAERDGRDYRFVDPATFRKMVEAGAFLEWAEVYGHCYGTAREPTERALEAGVDLLLDIDVQGARQIRRSGFEAVFIFVLPPDFETLRRRLEGRGTEGERETLARLRKAREEAAAFGEYDYVVVNRDVEVAAGELRAIVSAERRRTPRCRAEAEAILATFPDWLPAQDPNDEESEP